DLLVEGLTWRPLNPSPGELVTFTITMKNQGDDDASVSQVHYYIDGSQRGYSTIASIPAGGEIVKSFNWRIESLAYTVNIVADHDNNVAESNEANNEKELVFSGAPIPEPDLVIEDISWSPDHPLLTDTVTYTFTIKNQGAGNAAASQVYYYIDDEEQGSIAVPAIPPGDTATGTFTWSTEIESYTVKTVADYNDDIPEINETNNEKELASSEVYIADLFISDISWSPSSPSPTDTVTVTVTVKNQGNGAAGPFQVNYYADEIKGGGKSGTSVISSLAAGGTTTGTFTWVANTGAHGFSAVADHFDNIVESDEGNNFKLVTLSVTYSLPDLIVEDITWSPSNPAPGELVNFTYTIKNQGDGSAMTSEVHYYIDGSQQGFSNFSPIPAGGTATGTFTWKAELGEHTIKAITDYNDNIAESDETNNEKESALLEVLLIDLIVDDITWSPLNPFLDEEFTFTVTIKNQGDNESGLFRVYYYIDGSQKEFTDLASIPAGNTTTDTFTWKAKLGEHIIEAIADYNNDVPEGNETNNEKYVTFSDTTVPEPDLIIENVTWYPLNPSSGDTVTFTTTLKNLGSGRARSFWVYYYLNGIRMAPPGRILEIQPGDTWTETFIWDALPGTHQIKLVADPYNQLGELDETNNQKEITLIVE
ncbi:CARDB domain-containing protein, partial [Chloroflexota bacterium]